MMKKLSTLLLMLMFLSGLSSQNIWDGSESTDFADVDNWSGDQNFDKYATCNIGAAALPCVYNSNAKTFVVEMLDSGHLTVTNTFYVDKLFMNVGAAKSNIVIKDGGLVSIRNGASTVAEGTITVLDGGTFECKSGIYFIWGRWDNDSCFFNLFGGTADFSTFAPWRNGYINDAQIVCKGGGVGTFAKASDITDWAAAGKLIPAEGSILSYDAVNSPTTLSSIDLALPASLDTTLEGGAYSLPDLFHTYATGDTANAATVAVVQTPAAGTVYNGVAQVNVKVSATDALGNVLVDSLMLNINDVATPVCATNEKHIAIYSAGGMLMLQADKLSEVHIYALSGALVKSSMINEGKHAISLEPGLYVVRVSCDDRDYMKKIIVK